MSNRYPVYVVDDEAQIRSLLADLCEVEGWDCTGFATGSQFLDVAAGLAPGCLILDMRMPGWNGLKVQNQLAEQRAPFAVIAVTGHGDVEMAVESMKLGSIDFIEKPYDNEVLVEAVQRAFAKLEADAR